jgi:hypothetical protein
MQRMRFVFLVLIAAMLGALISMVNSRPGWDDTGVSPPWCLVRRGLWVRATRNGRVWALAVGSWIPALGLTLGHGYASIVALAFALVGAYAGAFAGRWLNREANNP